VKPDVLFAVNRTFLPKLFSDADMQRIEQMCHVLPAPRVSEIDHAYLLEHVAKAQIVITSWGTARLDEAVIAKADQLRLLAHAAGSVKPVVSDALWDRYIAVTSSAAAIAFGVAEFCLGLILTATKRAFWGGIATRQNQWESGIDVFGGPNEIYQQNVGIIGASHVGRRLIRLLQQFDCQVLLYDPFCSEQQASEYGAVKVDTLGELFSQCMVVSLNAPYTETTHEMIRKEHFELLPDGALFINTARGAIVHEPGMIDALKTGRFVACIDVTEPEPPADDSPLRTLPNVWLTPHEAGAVAQNLLRIGTFVADEIQAFTTGQPLRYPVTHQQLMHIG
jgi:phosphoglycerate dehydrogenase-like enzyme